MPLLSELPYETISENINLGLQTVVHINTDCKIKV